MPAILGLLGLGAACAAGSAIQNNKTKNTYHKMVSQGAYKKIDFARNRQLFQEYWMQWFRGDGECIPEEYRAYCRRNKDAAKEYLSALTSQQLIKEGLAPVFHNDGCWPFAKFESLYEDNIKLFNENSPEGFHARFYVEGKSDIEIATYRGEVYKAIMNYGKHK